MAPEKERKPPREEFEVAHHSKQRGRPPQRKLLQRRSSDGSDSDITAASHAEEPAWEGYGPPPPEDRAG